MPRFSLPAADLTALPVSPARRSETITEVGYVIDEESSTDTPDAEPHIPQNSGLDKLEFTAAAAPVKPRQFVFMSEPAAAAHRI
jgi:hypothetical protein